MASTNEKPTNGKPKAKAKPDKKPKCGIVMPISDLDGYTSQHWADVREILFEVARSADLDVNLVSTTDEVTVIHKTIIQNLYSNEIVICDVSGKNPNVMFELGMRLTFDKPTIIIKDDITDFSFDTSVIEHLPYPHDLRYQTIVDFKETLKSKLLATLKKASSDQNYSPFLKHFGVHTVTGLQTREITAEKFMIESISDLTREIHGLRSEVNRSSLGILTPSFEKTVSDREFYTFTVNGSVDTEKVTDLTRDLPRVHPDLVLGSYWSQTPEGHYLVGVDIIRPVTLRRMGKVIDAFKQYGLEITNTF